MNGLSELRTKVRALDAEILRLVAERQQTARSIGQIKKSAQIPLRDWDVERQALEHAAREAEKLEIPQPLARSLMQVLISAACDEQERCSYSTYAGSAESILVIGGRGKMGRWFVDFFLNQGHRVSINDVVAGQPEEARRAALATAVEGTTLALLATPPDVSPRVIEQLTELQYAGVVFDISSLKAPLTAPIQTARERGLAITSIHPMFGPGTRTLSDQVICVCDCGHAEANERVESFFHDTAATLVRLSLEEHDRIVSYVLAASHLSNLLFTKVLMESGKAFADLNRVGSTTFHSQMVTTGTVIRENPELYYTIQKSNPFASELYDSFQRGLSAIADWVLAGDKAAFTAMMDKGRKWMNNHDPR